MSKVGIVIGNKDYVSIRYYCFDGRLSVSIGVKVTKDQLKYNKIPIKPRQRINRIKASIEDYAAKCDLANISVYKADVEKLIIEAIGGKRKPKSDKLSGMFGKYVDMLKSGELTNNGKLYSKSVIQIHDAILNEYLKIPEYGDRALNDFKSAHFGQFKNALINLNKSQNTISLYISYLLTFFKRTHKMKWHSNDVYLDEDIRVSADDIDTQVYLSVEELKTIWEHPVRKKWEKTRDVFIFGCFTGLRWSDYSKIDTDSLKNGILSIDTQKKGKVVHIPLHPIAKSIWDKYNGVLPVRSFHGHFNTTVRNVCKEVGINERCLSGRTQGGKRVSAYKEKWELIGSHTARRSFSTNAFKAGVPSISIMRITGHKTEVSFLKYIRITNEENAELMKGHAFFK